MQFLYLSIDFRQNFKTKGFVLSTDSARIFHILLIDSYGKDKEFTGNKKIRK